MIIDKMKKRTTKTKSREGFHFIGDVIYSSISVTVVKYFFFFFGFGSFR